MEVENYPDVVERFIRYVKISTASSPDSDTIPSSKRQFDLANLLVSELHEIGIENAYVDEKCVVYAYIDSNVSPEIEPKIPVIAFNAHLDTAGDESGENVQPRIIQHTGDTITFPDNPNLRLEEDDLLPLKRFIGQELITASGTTLLGADDKAGIAEIMAAAIQIIQTDLPHGKIWLIFNPDEEIGLGADRIDLSKIDAKFAYTIDGDEEGCLECENFNAAAGKIEIIGYNVHPGYAYGKMINSIRLIPQILELFPPEAAPETTQGKESYYHPTSISGDVNKTSLKFILRNFNAADLDHQIHIIEAGIENLKNTYPRLKFKVKIEKGYRNMKDILDQHPYVVDIVRVAMKQAGVEIIEKPIRGGTDGAQLSYRELPTPNIFTGGINFHSKKELIPIASMEKAVEVIKNIIYLVFQKYSE